MTKKPRASEIEKSIYGEGGLYSRVIEKLEIIGTGEASKMTGKKRQYIDLFKRQYFNREQFDYRPQFNTIREIADKLGVE
jgi:hypothetical protein